MIRLKTGALFRAVCHIGALLGGADLDIAYGLARYGEHVGIAFQIRDDLLDYLGTPEQTGKPGASDLRNGRPTLPLLLAYDAATDMQRLELLAVLDRRGAGEGDVEWVSDLIEELGAVRYALDQMTTHAEFAHAELETLAPSPSVDVLAGIAHWTTSNQP
jgi:geranylgeranyl diphosphate synthase type I